MGQFAERVYNDPATIARLEALIAQLPTNACVTLHLEDGSDCTAVASVRPSIQLFRDGAGREGYNAVVRLERADQPAWDRTVWLDQIVRVEHLDSTLGGEN